MCRPPRGHPLTKIAPYKESSRCCSHIWRREGRPTRRKPRCKSPRAVEQVSSVPGVKVLAARQILCEIGTDMSRFASDANLVSWACICPRSDESAGKRRSTRIRKGSPWLKTTLVQCAWAASRKKDSYLHAQFHRIKARRGPKKAIVAVAGSILTAIYHMLKDGTMYQDLGPNHFDARAKERQKNRLIKRLTEMGYAVQVAPLPA